MKHMKWIALLSAFMLILSGCTWTNNTSKEKSTEENYYSYDLYTDEFAHRLQYQQLSPTEQHCYGEVYTAVQKSAKADSFVTDSDGNTRPGIRVPLSQSVLSEEQISRIFEAFFRDNPQFFFLDRTYSISGEQTETDIIYNVFLLQYTMDTKQRSEAIDQLNKSVATMLTGLPTTDDEFELEMFLHNRLLTHCVYDDIAATSSSSVHANAYSAYGALVEGKAVCEGYAKAMQLLLENVGIDSTVILGQSAQDGEPHMWNLVQINDEYYYLDPTWNDSENGIHYSYFNMTSTQLLRSHIIDNNQLICMECTAKKDNYFKRNGTYIDTFERETIAQVISERLMKGDTAIHLQFAEGKYESGLLFLKNATLTKKLVNSYLTDASLWDYQIKTQPSQNTLSIYKKEN